MMIPPRRALSILLAAALLLGSVPSEVSAQVARITIGGTAAMPVTPAGNSAAAAMTAPALSLGAASLDNSFSAPAIAPSPVARTAAGAVAVVTAAAVPALAASPRAAAAQVNPQFPEAAKAAAPVAKKTWTERLSSLLARNPAATKAAEAKTPSTEAAKADADAAFDGSAEKETANEGMPVSAGNIEITRTGLKASISNRFNIDKAHDKRKLHIDEFGGPLTEPMTFKQRAGYGLKQGLNLVGIGAILNMTLRPVLDLFPWPQYLSDSALGGFGRMALLTKFGPNEIAAGLAAHPLTFLGIDLPMAVTLEEITYRLFGFGLTFLALAAIKPVSRWLATMIDGLPDASGVVGGAKRLLKLGDWVSHFAFPLAALLSSVYFAVAHFATWGYSPFVLALNLILGLFLARTAYKSRGLTSPILAHLVFNLVMVGGVLIAMAGSPFAGAAFSIIAGLIGTSSLLHTWLTARKENAFRLKNFGAKALFAAMIATSSLSMWQGGAGSGAAARAQAASAVVSVQHKAETAAAVVADTVKTGAAAIESRADMVARVKPSVVNVIVHRPGGYTIGSGFILTPEGVFVTNGHVVGDKKPGDIINAHVPGVDGELKATVLAVNHDKDLAIVQLQARPDGKPWPVVVLATKAPREGEMVTAIGYPHGLPFTVSQGVVSGMAGRGSIYVRKLQTDAAINPGNSGGPLFNDRGEVIGVNTEIRTESGGSEGLGFSIQAPEVAHIMAQYAQTGNIATASLGIIVNLSDPEAPGAGLAIEYIRHGSAAEIAGLKRGDLLIGVGAAKIAEGGQKAAGHVASVLSKLIPGQTVTLTVLRGDEPLELKLTVDAKTTAVPSR